MISLIGIAVNIFYVFLHLCISTLYDTGLSFTIQSFSNIKCKFSINYYSKVMKDVVMSTTILFMRGASKLPRLLIILAAGLQLNIVYKEYTFKVGL